MDRALVLLLSDAPESGAVVSTVLGHVFVLFNSKVVAYRSFFLTAVTIHFFSVCLLFTVFPAKEKRRAARAAKVACASKGALSKALLSSAPLMARSAPVVAQMCDRLSWRSVGIHGRVVRPYVVLNYYSLLVYRTLPDHNWRSVYSIENDGVLVEFLT